MKPRFTIMEWSIVGVVLMVLLNGCSKDPLAGATTETTNGIVGKVVLHDDLPAFGAEIALLPEDYDPVTDTVQFVETADKKGSYRFRHIAAGKYTILARNKSAKESYLVRNVVVTDDAITAVAEGMLDKSGSVAADLSLAGNLSGGYAFIPGTDVYSMIGSDGAALLDDVPPGTITAIVVASAGKEKKNVLRDEIVIAAGATAVVVHPLWSHKQTIVLNTSAAGAAVQGDVTDFPVLVRLTSANFNFSQAAQDGADILFTDASNSPLSRQIERFDAALARAEIWVKIPLLRGNSADQSITMYWGNPDASAASGSGEVFDTAAGFTGVWHLGDAASDSVSDATVNRYHGGSPDTARPAISEGIIGACRDFDGASDYIEMPGTADSRLNFTEKSRYTVSAWVMLDTFNNKSHCIVAKGFEQYYLRSTYIGSTSDAPRWEFVEFSNADKWQTSTCPVEGVRQWAFVTAVRQGERQSLYCNGELLDSTILPWSNDASRTTTNNLSIGKFLTSVTLPVSEGYCHFKGKIDEVRILSVSQNPDWVKLCYMNQRSDNRLVEFK